MLTKLLSRIVLLFALFAVCFSCGQLEPNEEPEQETEIKVESISLNQTTLTLNVGEEYRLIHEISPTNATNQDVVWESNNTSIATVYDDGTVLGVKKGMADILVRTIDGGKISRCKVTVIAEDKVSVSGVTLSESEVSMYVGDEYQLTAEISPSTVFPSVSRASSGWITASP